jgi:hypothetical protein
MTPDERSLLQKFLQDLVQTRGTAKDTEADSMIAQALRASPDAGYVLVQHAILSDQALQAAQEQIADLQNQLRNVAPPPQSTGFLGRPSPWAQAAQPMPPPPPQGFMGPGPFNSGGGLGSFLRSAGTTAAGVAGGALLFEGLSGLFGGHGGGGFGGFGGGGFGGGGFGGGAPIENITNNYYEDGDDRSDFGGGDQGGGWDDGGSDDS